MQIKSKTDKALHKKIPVLVSDIRYFDHRNKIHCGFLERYHRQSMEQRLGLPLAKPSYPVAFHGRILHIFQPLKQPMERTIATGSIHLQASSFPDWHSDDNAMDEDGMMECFKEILKRLICKSANSWLYTILMNSMGILCVPRASGSCSLGKSLQENRKRIQEGGRVKWGWKRQRKPFRTQ